MTPAQAVPERVNFFLVGCQKSGTTWLHRCLREHPGIFVPAEDEIHYFDIHHFRGPDWYQHFYQDWNGQKRVGDTTSSYIRDAAAAERIFEYNPQARIVVALRNPVDRAFSHYWHEKKKGKAAFSFEEWESNYDLFDSWLGTGFYLRHLERYERLFGRDNLLVLIQEEMLADPDQALERLYAFLGVQSDFRGPHAAKRVNVAPGGVPGGAGQEYAHGMDAATRRHLEALFAPERARLEAWLGRRLEIWDGSDRPERKAEASSAACTYLHRVLPEVPAFGGDRINTVSLASFKSLIGRAAETRRVVGCGEFVDHLDAATGSGPGRFAISFDDGYRDIIGHALPVLEAHELPVTLFITTGFIDGTVVPYETVLSRFLETATSLVLDPAKPDQTRIAVTDGNRAELYERLRKAFKFRPHEDRMRFLRDIGADPILKGWNAGDVFLTPEELARLAGHPLVTIGAHTVTHPALTSLDSQSLIRELRDSRVYLENLVGRTVDLLAYPYGDANANVRLAARACGYRAAFGTESASASLDSSSRILQIPRINPELL